MNIYSKTLLFFGVLLFTFHGIHAQSIKIIDKEEIKTHVIGKEVQFIDVRTAEEYDFGHIDDAVNFNIIDRKVFISQIQKLDKDQPVYLYCKVGGRSNRAAKLLKEKGFKKIFDYSGGYNDWVTQ